MTNTELIQIITLAVPKMADGSDRSNNEAIAGYALKMAIAKVGRTQSVAFNRKKVSFDLTASQRSYNIGEDIISDFPAVWNIQYLYMDDSPGYRCNIVTLDVFNDYASGNNQSGRPRIATIHSSDKEMEFFPTPDSNYTMTAYAKTNVLELSKIPDAYHDVVASMGILIVQSTSSGQLAIALAADNKDEVQKDSQTAWSGSYMQISRHLGANTSELSSRNSNSYNMTGE